MIATPDRSRLALDLAPTVASLLDYVSEVTGVPKTQLVQSAVLDALPELLERADKLKKRNQELTQSKKK